MLNSTLIKKAINKGLKICHIDIETSPMLVYTYGLHDVYIAPNQIMEPMKVTSLAYMFEGDKKPKAMEWLSVKYDTIHYGSDQDMLEEFVPIINSADIVIAQNGDAYDIKVLQWRLNELKLPPIKNLITLDTLKLSRKVFRPASHKLDYRSQVYGFGGKIKQDMDDCIAVAQGDVKKQKLRVKYNIKDVVDLRKIFWRELDYYTLPKSLVKALENYIKDPRPFCIKCASKRQKRFDVKSIRHNKQQKFQCNRCDYIWKPKKQTNTFN